MTQDVRQWLAEIKHLQQKLVEAHQERDEAYAGAGNWRKLYEREAQQRRTDASLAAQTIEALKTELEELRGASQPATPSSVDLPRMQQQVDHLEAADLKQKLVETMLECDRLAQALKAEQESHTQTRNSLTVALGDTVDLLTKERSARNNNHSEATQSSSSAGGIAPVNGTNGSLEAAKTPSLELPPLNPVQSLV